MSSKPQPAIWSRDTGQRIPCFDRCQLTIAWMFNIKDTRCKPRLQDLVLTRVRPPCCVTSLSLGALARDPCLLWEKSCMGFYFYVLCMWSCSYSYGAPLGSPLGCRELRCKKNGAACQKCCEVPLMRVTKILFCRYDVKFFSPLWGINSKTTHYFLSLFCQYLEKYCKSSHCGLLRLNTLEIPNPCF